MATKKVTFEGFKVVTATKVIAEGESTNEVTEMLASIGLSWEAVGGGHKLPTTATTATVQPKVSGRQVKEEEAAPPKGKKDDAPPKPATRAKADEIAEEEEEEEAPPPKRGGRSKPAKAEEEELEEDEGEEEEEEEGAPPPKKGKKKGGGEIDTSKLQSAAKLREIVQYIMDQGHEKLEDVIKVCEEIQQDVPLLRRVADIPGRVKNAYEVLKEGADA
jgi:hypothetical protein